MSDEQYKLRPLAKVFLILSAVGFAGFIGVVVVRQVNSTFPMTWATVLGSVFGVLMFGGPLATGYVPVGPLNAYTHAERDNESSVSSIPEFLPSEATVVRIRCTAIISTLWILTSVWILCFAIPLAILISLTVNNPDVELDSNSIIAPMLWGLVILVFYSLLVIFLPQFTSQRPHLRALGKALPEAAIVPNRTSFSLARMVKHTAPGVRARMSSRSYIALTRESVTVWFSGNKRLTKAVEISLASITDVERAYISLATIGLQGIAITTTELTQPLELCPIDHIVDFQQSAERLNRLLSAKLQKPFPSR